MPKVRNPPSQTWRTFLDNHFRELVSIDFLSVPTATFRVLYVLVVLAHDRRRVVHFNVTEHPTAVWTAQQIIEAFPEETAPRFLHRDRDQIYGEEFRRRVAGMRIEEVMTAPHSPWQSPYVEKADRLNPGSRIGSFPAFLARQEVAPAQINPRGRFAQFSSLL